MTTKHSLEQILGVSKDLFKIASLSDAILEHCSPNRLVVKSVWSQLDIEKNERTKFQRSHVFEVDGKSKTSLLYASHPEALRSEVWNSKSPDNKLNAVVFNWKDNSEEKQFLEIWKDGVRTENINLTKLDKHAKIYEKSALLGSFEWSSDSTKIAYVAETKNEAKEKCLFNSKLAGEDGVNESNYEQKYAHFLRDEWGEQYLTKSESTIAVFDVLSNQVKVLENLPKDFVPAQLSWYKNQGLVFNGMYTKPYRLGLVYCPIRKSELFYYDLEQNKCTQITDLKSEAVRCPQFSHDFTKVCWLQNQAGGPHFQCSKLMMMNWEDKSVDTLIDIVHEYPTDDQSFPGIFSYTLPSKSCWSVDSQRILINTTWKHVNRLVSIDVNKKTVTDITASWNRGHTCNLLKLDQDWILVSEQAYNKRPSLVIAKLPPIGQELDIQWNQLSQEDSLEELATVEVLKFKPSNPHPSYPNLEFDAWFVDAKKRNDTLIVFPHGGPHSSFAGDFSAYIAVFYSLGYSVLLLNFRGSSGYGQDSINSLPGHISKHDVQDCQQAAEHVFSKYNFKNAVVTGGSHGGFLTCQLIGQYPDFYKAAVARNPVTHLESMFFLTDIPDWCVCESVDDQKYDPGMQVTPEILAKMYERSPMRHVEKVKTPTLLMIGMVDLRVPPSQGISYYKALLARNVPTKLLSFKEDNHPLEKPQTLADCIVHMILWFEKNIQ